MEEIYKDKYFIIYYDKKKQFIKSVWLPETINIVSNNTIQKEIEKAVELLKEKKPKKLLADDRDRQFAYSVSLQEWVARQLGTACAEAGVEKFAVVYPEDFIAKISTELTASEVEVRPYRLRMFSDEDEAIKWLLED